MTLREGIAEVGGDPSGSRGASDIKAFLELHIEQGPVLEDEKLDIGVVTAIAGITRIEIVVEGRADHAGTTPMGARKDALAAAARLVLGVEAAAASTLASGEQHFAATVGEFAIEPERRQRRPSRARLLIDARAEQRAGHGSASLPNSLRWRRGVAAETGVTIRAAVDHFGQFPNALRRRS